MNKGAIVAVIFFILVGLGFVAFGVVSMTNSKSDTVGWDELSLQEMEDGVWVDGEVYLTTPTYLEVTHYTNLIPTGKEYYYLVFNEDFSECISIRAGKDFYDEFDEDGFSEDGIKITGKVKDNTSENRSQLMEVKSELAGEGIAVDIPSYYIDTTAGTLNIIAIIIGLLILLACILSLVAARIENNSYAGEPKALKGFNIVLMVAAAVLFIYFVGLV